MKRKSVFLILALAALSAVPAFAKEGSSGGFAAFWAWAIPWVDGRMIIDPNGLESGSCSDPWGGCHQESLRSGDEGLAIDPFGLEFAGRPEGSGIDPHGAGSAMDPNGKEQGSAADPYG
jgi:hypothetical protein